ncbi:MAG: cytochrome c [Candidatus Acidiferrales bacterium]
MRNQILTIVALMSLASIGLAQDKAKDAKQPAPAEFKIPPEDARKPNPLKVDATSIAEGKREYSSQCSMCHGKDGDGKGDLAQEMQLKMRDFQDPASLKDMTDGELFYILSKGKGDMPEEGDRMDVNQRWQLIIFIRSLASKQPAATSKQEKPQ